LFKACLGNTEAATLCTKDSDEKHSSSRAQLNIFIGICSSHRYAERRAAVRETWLKQLPDAVTAFFFVGEGPRLEEPDVLQLPAGDGYDRLPEKVRTFCRHVLAHYQFDYMFKCDDDTYVCVERLFDLLQDDSDFIGSADQAHKGFASGGAGYFLSRKALRLVAEATAPGSGAEDVWVGKLLQEAGIKLHPTQQLQMDHRVFPLTTNRLVTAHWCEPAVMKTIHQEIVEPGSANEVISFYARHAVWQGKCRLLSNGVFVGGAEGPGSGGRWETATDGEWLALHWFHQPKDTLQKTAFGYANLELKLERLDLGLNGRKT